MIDEKCFRVLENLIQPLQGDVAANLMLIVNGTIPLIKFHKASSIGQQRIDSIVHWLISLLDKYPNQTCVVLSAFIKHILTIPALNADTNDRLRNIDICVQYDSAMYTKCNQSFVDYLKKLACSSDVYDRESCVEMVGKMLLVDSLPCSWSTSAETVPREIELLSLLVTKLLDISNSIKVKAVNIFIKVSVSGNAMCKRILQVLHQIQFKNTFYRYQFFRAFYQPIIQTLIQRTSPKVYLALRSSTIYRINYLKLLSGI